MRTIEEINVRRERRLNVIKNIPFDRLKQICNAEKEGRLVVLPVNVGEVVYFITKELDIAKGTLSRVVDEYIVTETRGNKYNHLWYIASSERCVHRDFHPTEIGKTVFLTKEEALKALKGDVKS